MICAATAKRNDMIHLHPGVDVGAGRANDAGQYRTHVGQGHFANSKIASPAIIAGGAGDGFGALGVVSPPLKDVLIERVRILFAILPHLLSVLLGMFLSPLLGSLARLRPLHWILVAFFTLLSIQFGILFSVFPAPLTNLIVIEIAPRLIMSEQAIPMFFSVACLIGAILLGIGQTPRRRTLPCPNGMIWLLARPLIVLSILGACLFRIFAPALGSLFSCSLLLGFIFHVDNLHGSAGKSSRINAV